MLWITLWTSSQLFAQQTNSTGASPVADPVLIKEGQVLFTENCSVCHQFYEKVVGPALQDVHKRRPIRWIKDFVTNSQKVIKNGDAYAVNLYEEYGKTQMPSFDFSERELNAIISYIKAESIKPPPTAQDEKQLTETGNGNTPKASIGEWEVKLLWVSIITILLLLALILAVFAGFLKDYALKKDTISEEDRDFISSEGGFRKIIEKGTFLSFVLFFFVAIVVKVALDGLFSIGVQQGYAPQQPIAFSHKIHAGEYKIECSYCHTGVLKSKFANIPSANICLNCHREIKKESPEIQKIHTAYASGRPIEWVRVHNLPDLSYFNHSQHVVVGELDCEVCHGDVKKMDVVYQYAELTMGWCINCHRTEEVKTEKNPYYEKIRKIKNSKPVTVEDIGGLECAKCHY